MRVQVDTPERVQSALENAEGAQELGPRLGALCLQAQLPWSLVAKVLGVARPTVYRWVFGKTKIVGKANRRNAERLIQLLQLGLNQSLLPSTHPADGLRKTMATAKQRSEPQPD